MTAIPMDCLHRTLFQVFRSFRLILRFQIMFSNINKTFAASPAKVLLYINAILGVEDE